MEDASAPAVPEREPALLLAELYEAGDEAGAIAYAGGLHPAELANACAGVEGDLRDLLVSRLAAGEIGAMLGYLEPHYREDLLVGLPPERIAAILSGVSDDVGDAELSARDLEDAYRAMWRRYVAAGRDAALRAGDAVAAGVAAP